MEIDRDQELDITKPKKQIERRFCRNYTRNIKRNHIHMRAKKTQYKAPIIGRGMEARTAPNFPVHGQKCSTISLKGNTKSAKMKYCIAWEEK